MMQPQLIAPAPDSGRAEAAGARFNSKASGRNCLRSRHVKSTAWLHACSRHWRKEAMQVAVKIESRPGRPGAGAPTEVVRDFAALLGAAAAIGVGVSLGLILMVVGLS
jgi:hypothetical protein